MHLLFIVALTRSKGIGIISENYMRNFYGAKNGH